MPVRRRRSTLYMPASNPRAIEKARGLACDVVILDLEDAVAPDLKVAARLAAVAAVRDGGFGNRELVVRVNALDTPWGADDLAALRDVRPDAVLLPKVSAPDALFAARAALGTDAPFWAMIETCRAIMDMSSIVTAATAGGLGVLVAGTNDLAKEMRCHPGADRMPLHFALSQIVTAARMVGLEALDGVCNVIDDAAALGAECRQGVTFGFDGKTLIHPAQIDTANSVFSPTSEAVEWARKIVAGFDDQDGFERGAIRLEGRMVEVLHLEEARRTLALAETTDRQDGA